VGKVRARNVGDYSVHVKYCGVLEGPGGNCWACIGTLTNATSSITRGITYLDQALIKVTTKYII